MNKTTLAHTKPTGPLDPQSLVGKTIEAVDATAVNLWVLTFTDRTRVILDTEAQGYGLYGPVMYSEEDSVPGENPTKP